MTKLSEVNNSIDWEDLLKRISTWCIPISLIADLVTIILFIFAQDPKLLFVALIIMIICITIILLYVAQYILKRVVVTDKARNKLELALIKNNVLLASTASSFFSRLSGIILSTNSTESSATNYVEQTAVQICDSLESFYSALLEKYTGKRQVAVCIKLIDTNEMFEEDFLHSRLRTLARSGSTNQARISFDNTCPLIADNSDFMVILSDDFDSDYFVSPDLTKIEKEFLDKYKMPYKNSRRNYLKYYQSTIVVPIKFGGKSVASELKAINPTLSNKNLIFGFLCIDSPHAFTTEIELEAFKSALEFAKGFANSIYVYLEKVMVTRLNLNQ